jgi:RNA polymerase sigma factor (sigma-70 family)
MAAWQGQAYDEWLILRAQGGDAPAAEELAHRLNDRLWRYARRLTNSSDHAWDVMQDSWLAMVRGLGKLKDPAAFKTWAYRIVTNKAADWLRRHVRRKHDLLAVEPPDPVDAQGARDTASDIRALLAKLPPSQQTVLMLYYLDDLSVGEISRVLQIPPGTVKSRLHAGRDKLKAILAPDHAG